MQHAEEHETRLSQLVSDGRSFDRARVRQLALGCAECERKLAALSALEDRLESSVRERDAILAEARAAARPEHAEQVLRGLRAAAAQQDVGRLARGPRRIVKTMLAWSAIAALVVVSFVIATQPAVQPPLPDVVLGDKSIELVQPRGVVEADALTRFEWRYDGDKQLPPQWTFEIEIVLERADAPPFTLRTKTRERSLTATPALQAALAGARSGRWHVSLHSTDELFKASAEQAFSLSR